MELKKQEKFLYCEEALSTRFKPLDRPLFRFAHDPFIKNDGLTQDEQEWEDMATLNTDLPQTLDPGSSVEMQVEHIRNHSLSFFTSEQEAAEFYFKLEDKRRSPTKKAQLRKRIGDGLRMIDPNPEYGLIQNEIDLSPKGHTVLVESKIFNFEDHYNKDYGFKPIDELKND